MDTGLYEESLYEPSRIEQVWAVQTADKDQIPKWGFESAKDNSSPEKRDLIHMNHKGCSLTISYLQPLMKKETVSFLTGAPAF